MKATLKEKPKDNNFNFGMLKNGAMFMRTDLEGAYYMKLTPRNDATDCGDVNAVVLSGAYGPAGTPVVFASTHKVIELDGELNVWKV